MANWLPQWIHFESLALWNTLFSMAQRVNSFVSALWLEFHQNDDQSCDRTALFDNNVYKRFMRCISEVAPGLNLRSGPTRVSKIMSSPRLVQMLWWAVQALTFSKKLWQLTAHTELYIYIHIYTYIFFFFFFSFKMNLTKIKT